MRLLVAAVVACLLASLAVVVFKAPAAPPSNAPGWAAGGNMIAGVTAAQAADVATDEAYMRLHPVPERPGWTPGIITSVVQHDNQCATSAGTQTAAVIEPAAGDPPCIIWAFTIVTASGATLRAVCGSPGHPCKAPDNVLPGEEGEYLYVPSDGTVSPAEPVMFLGCWTSQAYPCPFEAQVLAA